MLQAVLSIASYSIRPDRESRVHEWSCDPQPQNLGRVVFVLWMVTTLNINHLPCSSSHVDVTCAAKCNNMDVSSMMAK
jgi:hypothetical protein